jgi:hypothetical protein
MPHGLVTQFTDELLVDMCAHMAANRGVLALGGTSAPQGGHLVIDHVDELAHWYKPFRRLRKACHAHARDVLAGQSILNVGSWAKLDAGSAAASFENSAYHHCGVAYGAVAPHTDKGDETDVRVCFSFCASANAGFFPPAWHAGATVEECIAGVVGHIFNGSVTLQLGGVGAHAMGPLAPGDVRLAVLCNVKLSTKLDWSLLAAERGVGCDALRLSASTHASVIEMTKNLSLSNLSLRAQKRVKGST